MGVGDTLVSAAHISRETDGFSAEKIWRQVAIQTQNAELAGIPNLREERPTEPSLVE